MNKPPTMLHGWATNGDRLWASRDGQHTDYGHLIEFPGHPKSGDLVETDKGRYILGEPLMQDSPMGWVALALVVAMIALGLAYKHLIA